MIIWFSASGAVLAAGIYRYSRDRAVPDGWKSLECLLPLVVIIESIVQFLGRPLLHLIYILLIVVISGFFPFRIVASCILAILLSGIPSFWKDIYVAARRQDAAYGNFDFNLELLKWLYPLIFFTGIVSYYIFSREVEKKRQAVRDLETLKDRALNLETPTERSPFRDDRLPHLVRSVLETEKELTAMLNLTGKVMNAEIVLLYTIEKNDVVLKASTVDNMPEPSDEDKKYVSGLIKGNKTLVQAVRRGTLSGLSHVKPDDARTFLFTPVLDGNIPLGAVVMYSNRLSAYGEEEKTLAAEFASHVKQILKRSRIYSEVERFTTGFKALHEASRNLSTYLEVDKIAEVLVGLLSGMVSSSAVAFFIADKGQLRVIAKKGFEPEKEAFYPKDTCFNFIVKNRQILHFSNPHKRHEVYPFRTSETRTFLGIPVVADDEVLGVLAIASSEPEAINSFQEHLIRTIADQATMSIINAKLHKKVEMLAITDGLTGLYNHKHFQGRLDEEIQRVQRIGNRLSLMLVDIDHFKRINDTYGHPAGDTVLKKVAQILKKTLRGIDIISRYGGEEFAVVLMGTDRSGARKMAERLRVTVMNNPFLVDDAQIRITLSIGLTVYPDDASTKEELINRTDQALYHAKGNGRNQVCVWDETVGKN